MSDGAAVASTSAQPAAVARAVVAQPSKKGGDAFAEAREDMRALRDERKLKLVQDTGEPSTVDPEEPDTQPIGDPEPDAPKPDEGDDETKEPEKVPSWAQRLKDDVQAKSKEVAGLQARDTKWQQALSGVSAKLTDATDELTHFKSLAETMGKFLVEKGLLDQREIDLASRDLELHKLKRQASGRQQSAQSTSAEQAKAQHVEQITTTIADLVKKHPELDHKKNPDAAGFIKGAIARWRAEGNFSFLDGEAQRWVRGWRAEKADEAAKANAKKNPQRAQATTLARSQDGARGVSRPEKGAVPKFYSDKDAKAEIAAMRAQRQG